MYYVAYITKSARDDVRNWFERLTLEQRIELGGLDAQWREAVGTADADPIMDICSDWIEEHGGEREWWGTIRHELKDDQ